MLRQSLLVVLILFGQTVAAAEPAPFKLDDAGYHKQITPFLTQYCTKCHNDKLAEGEFSITRDLSANVLDPATKAKWGEVVNVLNSHEMPPEKEPQPKPDAVAYIVEWVTNEMTRAEYHKRETTIVLRRLNRAEYKNTIRDLTGVDFDISTFPQDTPSGGFDNIGKALTLSPMLIELYYDAAQMILNEGLVTGTKPESVKWRFEIDSGDADSKRQRLDKSNNPIVNGGKNRVEQGFKVMHHESWDRKLNVRDFRVPTAGSYIIRVRAGGKVPTRAEVVASAKKYLNDRMQKEIAKNPKREKYIQEQFKEDLEHFETDRMYDYGPPRMKVIQNLGGQPKVLAELDIPAPHTHPEVYEIPCEFSTVSAGISIEYDYSIPSVPENFWFQTHDDFARPELWVDWIELEGPVYPIWPPKSVETILGKPKSKDETIATKEILSHFMSRAYRRPVEAIELQEMLDFYQQTRKEGNAQDEALKLTLASVLVSPNFLFLVEPTSSAGSTQKLNAYQLASRLSYFLWSTMPDAELFKLAENNQLTQPVVLKQQITCMLKDPKSREFVTNFAGQWLSLREVGANPPTPDLYPEYDRHLEVSIVKESQEFFATILDEKLPLQNFIDSDFIVINERLARFYGIPNIKGDKFRKVPVPSGIERGGIMTQASILSITSNGTRTSPVKRGVWVMKTLLGTDPGLPVANAGEIAPKVPGIDKATVRDRLEIHRELPQCARCHNKIDPLGFALENYNAAGQWRTQEGFGYKGRITKNDPKIDASSKLPDDTPINGIADLQRALLKKDELFYGCLTRKLMTYAYGRELALSDEIHVKNIVTQLEQTGKDNLPQLIELIVLSEPFQTK